MKLIARKCAPSAKYDRLVFRRDDGTRCEIHLPRQGILPHDLVYFVVESRLELPHGFLSLVAAGADARFATDLAHAANPRLAAPQAVQAEAIVEAPQTQLWSGMLDHDAFFYGIRTAAEARAVEPVAPIDLAVSRALMQDALALNSTWTGIPAYGSLELQYR